MVRPTIDLERDDFVLGDLRNIEKLLKMERPGRDQIRLYAATIRRLLLEGELEAATGRRGIRLEFRVPDTRALVGSAKGGHIAFFSLLGMTSYGELTAAMSPGPNGFDEAADRFDPDNDVVTLKVPGFIKQVVEFFDGQFLTRSDIITYVANKVGGVHYDPRPKRHLTEDKIRALDGLRNSARIGIEGRSLLIHTPPRGTDAEAPVLGYESNFVGMVFLELLACASHILESQSVQLLRQAIKSDLLRKKPKRRVSKIKSEAT